MKNFQGKAKQAAEEHNFYDDPGKKLGFRHGFIAGASWGLEQGFQEELEMLRENYINGGKGMADWLQGQRKRCEVNTNE